MTTLYEVIYVSNRCAHVSDREVIDGIVLPAGLKNRRLGITGVLWFSNKRFLQIIEGPRDAVESVYDAIQKDDRHQQIDTISSSPIAERSFNRWGMRALPGDQDKRIDEMVSHYTPAHMDRKQNPTNVTPESLIDQLRVYLVQLAAAEPVFE